jgi:hypothetical protein
MGEGRSRGWTEKIDDGTKGIYFESHLAWRPEHTSVRVGKRGHQLNNARERRDRKN